MAASVPRTIPLSTLSKRLWAYLFTTWAKSTPPQRRACACDRHAKKELKKLVRGVRPIERKLEKRREGEGQAVMGYCQAVRSALP